MVPGFISGSFLSSFAHFVQPSGRNTLCMYRRKSLSHRFDIGGDTSWGCELVFIFPGGFYYLWGIFLPVRVKKCEFKKFYRVTDFLALQGLQGSDAEFLAIKQPAYNSSPD